jgi:hypothetical protein
MVLNRDFREFLTLLNLNNVQYLVVGGYAVAFHGYPRYTKDLDLWISTDIENAKGMLKVLNDFGFSSLKITEDDFIKMNRIIQLGYPPNRIDIITSADGLEFQECYKARIQAEIENLKVNFIDLNNLKKNKKTTGRHQDLADLENLENTE